MGPLGSPKDPLWTPMDPLWTPNGPPKDPYAPLFPPNPHPLNAHNSPCDRSVFIVTPVALFAQFRPFSPQSSLRVQ